MRQVSDSTAARAKKARRHPSTAPRRHATRRRLVPALNPAFLPGMHPLDLASPIHPNRHRAMQEASEKGRTAQKAQGDHRASERKAPPKASPATTSLLARIRPKEPMEPKRRRAFETARNRAQDRDRQRAHRATHRKRGRAWRRNPGLQSPPRSRTRSARWPPRRMLPPRSRRCAESEPCGHEPRANARALRRHTPENAGCAADAYRRPPRRRPRGGLQRVSLRNAASASSAQAPSSPHRKRNARRNRSIGDARRGGRRPCGQAPCL